MELTWYGLSCFRMIERGMASIVTDPYGPSIGLPERKLRADIVTVSHDAPGHNYVQSVKGARMEITGPGEYEIGGVFITGISLKGKGGKKSTNGTNTLYVMDFDGLTVAHLGDLTSVPSQSEIEHLGTVDVALVPVGGGGALTPAKAAEVISLIEPSIVVPMHYKIGEEKIKLGGVSRFLSEMGVSKSEPQDSLKVTRSGLTEETSVVVLNPAS